MGKHNTCKVPAATTPPAANTPKANQAEAEIDRAVERIYQMYGGDLSLFFKAVQNQAQVERHEKDQASTMHAGC